MQQTSEKQPDRTILRNMFSNITDAINLFAEAKGVHGGAEKRLLIYYAGCSMQRARRCADDAQFLYGIPRSKATFERIHENIVHYYVIREI